MKEEEQEAAKLTAVFPCVLKIIPTCIFNQVGGCWVVHRHPGGWVLGGANACPAIMRHVVPRAALEAIQV